MMMGLIAFRHGSSAI